MDIKELLKKKINVKPQNFVNEHEWFNFQIFLDWEILGIKKHKASVNNWELRLFVTIALCSRIPIPFTRDQSGVVKFYGSFAFNRKRNVLELEIKQDYTSPGTQKYVVRSIFHILPTCSNMMCTLISISLMLIMKYCELEGSS